MAIIKRAGLGRPLTFAEMDSNWDDIPDTTANDSELNSLDMDQAGAANGQVLTANGSTQPPTWQNLPEVAEVIQLPWEWKLINVTSYQWIAPITGLLNIYAIGAGGGGLTGFRNANYTGSARTIGGGDGASIDGFYSVTKGDVLTITTGVGGLNGIGEASMGSWVTPTATNGSPTTINSSTINIVCDGGKGDGTVEIGAVNYSGGTGGTVLTNNGYYVFEINGTLFDASISQNKAISGSAADYGGDAILLGGQDFGQGAGAHIGNGYRPTSGGTIVDATASAIGVDNDPTENYSAGCGMVHIKYVNLLHNT